VTRRAWLLAVFLMTLAAWSITSVENAPLTAVRPIARRASTLHDPASGAYVGTTAPVPYPTPGAAVKSKRVLLVGIDGLRADALEAVRAPVLHALIQHGGYAPDALVRPAGMLRAVTSSGPGWSTILTGVWPDAHGVLENTFEGHRLNEHASVFARIDKPTVSLSNLPPINSLVCHAASLAPIVEDEPADYTVADAALAESASTALTTLDPYCLFVMFGSVDDVGHLRGFDPAGGPYRDAIARVDGHVGTLLEALKSRPKIREEDWLVIVTSDHGGHGTSHQYLEDPPAHVARTGLIVSGPSARPGLVREEAALVDVVPTILAHLGIPADPEWRLAGRPVCLRSN
jgi:hypothetical protein